MDDTPFFNSVMDEISQAKGRLLLGIATFTYVYFLPVQADGEISQNVHYQLTAMSIIVIVNALLLLIFLKKKYRSNPVRQVFSITFDILLLSYAFYLGGEWATVFIALFLWIIISNGLRYGLPFLIFAMILGTLSFFIVIKTGHYWRSNPVLSIGIMLNLIVLPLFFIYLISSLHKTREQLEKELAKTEHLARYDLLTGLPNRHSFNERLHHELEVAKRNQSYFSVLFMDLDGFKAVNDTYGHDAGDKLLIEVAQRLRTSVREIDLIARMGGDEFVCVTAAGNLTQNTSHLQQRLLEAVNKPMQLDDINLTISMSIGQARYPDDGEEFEQLLLKSDQNMYRKKEFNKKSEQAEQ